MIKHLPVEKFLIVSPSLEFIIVVMVAFIRQSACLDTQDAYIANGLPKKRHSQQGVRTAGNTNGPLRMRRQFGLRRVETRKCGGRRKNTNRKRFRHPSFKKDAQRLTSQVRITAMSQNTHWFKVSTIPTRLAH
jgi:hypothetical protein